MSQDESRKHEELQDVVLTLERALARERVLRTEHDALLGVLGSIARAPSRDVLLVTLFSRLQAVVTYKKVAAICLDPNTNARVLYTTDDNTARAVIQQTKLLERAASGKPIHVFDASRLARDTIDDSVPMQGSLLLASLMRAERRIIAVLAHPECSHFEKLHLRLMQSVGLVTDQLLQGMELANRAHENELKYRTLVEYASDGIGITKDCNLVYLNPRLVELLGLPRSRLMEQRFDSFVEPMDLESFQRQKLRLLEDRAADRSVEIRLLNGRGQQLFVEFNTARIIYEKQAAELIIVRDITGRKSMQEQLSQTRKLEAIGQLAAGVAHEINTPVQYIGDNLHFLQEESKNVLSVMQLARELSEAEGDTEELRKRLREELEELEFEDLHEQYMEAIADSLTGVRRVTEIVSAMRQFSHPGGKERSMVDLNKVIQEAFTVTRNYWKYEAEADLDLAEDLPLLMCYAGELSQVLLNLIINAGDAIKARREEDRSVKGKLYVSTRLVERAIELRLRDNGTGIPAKHRERVFDPFFTTKEIGQGTGQGLSIVFNAIVNHLGGKIELESEEGVGTEFIIRFPLDLEEEE